MSDNLPEGWTEAFPGGMATNTDPVKGGIIDNNYLSGEWFVIFECEHLPMLGGFSSRGEAFRAYEQAIS